MVENKLFLSRARPHLHLIATVSSVHWLRQRLSRLTSWPLMLGKATECTSGRG